MIFIIGGTLVGILLGMLIVRFVPQNVLGWVVMGLGAVALIFILPGLVAILIPSDAMFSPAITIPLGVGCVVAGIGAVRKNYRTWQVWFGLALGSIPLLFWIAFSIGEILYPH
ncbi:MAG: hypothetical protein HYZ25_02745 [Chloroflexi bacterium]|nr:hypothetical protein [Chloroflexota bacterium]